MAVFGSLMGVLGYLMGVLGYLVGVLGYVMGVLGLGPRMDRPRTWTGPQNGVPAPLSSPRTPLGHRSALPPSHYIAENPPLISENVH